jgi:hypothetical protein
MHTHIHTHTNTDAQDIMSPRFGHILSCIHTYIHTYTHTPTHTHTHTHTQMRKTFRAFNLDTSCHVYIHTYIHTYIYIHTHKHTQMRKTFRAFDLDSSCQSGRVVLLYCNGNQHPQVLPSMYVCMYAECMYVCVCIYYIYIYIIYNTHTHTHTHTHTRHIETSVFCGFKICHARVPPLQNIIYIHLCIHTHIQGDFIQVYIPLQTIIYI